MREKRKTYRCYILQWMMLCKYHTFDPCEPTVKNVTVLLRLLLEDGASFSTVNIARCALSALMEMDSGCSFGGDPMVSLVVNSCGNLKTAEHRYDTTWDVSRVFRFLEKWGRNKDLSLFLLSQKLTSLAVFGSS